MSLFLIGLIPIILFLVLLAGLKKSAMFSAYMSLFVAIVLTFVVPAWRMPVQGILASVIEGFSVAWMPIGFVVIAALFAYDLSVKTGKIETVKKMLGNITTDKRAQALVLAWGFGGFIEGIAGYGTAVAIPAAIMVSLGFNPLNAALICLIANSTPTAFGTVGLPVTTMVSKLGLDKTGNYTPLFTSLLLLILTCIIPFIIVKMANKEVEGGKNSAYGRGIIPIIVASILGYLIQPVIAFTMGAELPTILSSLFAMILMIVSIKIFIKNDENFVKAPVTAKEALLAWLPYILMIVLIVGTSPVVESIHQLLEPTTTKFNFALGNQDIWFRDGGDPSVTFKWLLAPAAPLFLATVLAGFVQKAKIKDMGEVLWHTTVHKIPSLTVIMGIVALSVVMKHSGMIQSIADGFVSLTGKGFPMISPFLGTIGTFVTGSDLSSNLLFGDLQHSVAEGLKPGSDILKSLLIASNTAGATGGKMISPQNIAIAASTVGLVGQEGDMLKFTIKYSIVYAIILGILVFIGSVMIA